MLVHVVEELDIRTELCPDVLEQLRNLLNVFRLVECDTPESTLGSAALLGLAETSATLNYPPGGFASRNTFTSTSRRPK